MANILKSSGPLKGPNRPRSQPPGGVSFATSAAGIGAHTQYDTAARGALAARNAEKYGKIAKNRAAVSPAARN
jgi:hypothetical protein